MMVDENPKPTRKPRMMSGARTTGTLHIGNYFGAIRNWIHFQNEYECYFGAMDLHGRTTAYKALDEMKKWNREIIAELVAWGLDPQKNVLFIQSQVPEHLELFMIFANLTPMSWLERVPTWKDAEDEAKASDTHNLGRFAYPVLQAADIAIYGGMKVPVGQDQVAHIELAREIIRRFNHLYKAKLAEPQAVLTASPVIPGLDGRKMSKSYGNTLYMTEEPKSLEKKIKAMPTDPQRARREDPGDPLKCNVYSYHKLFSSTEDLEWAQAGCRSAGIGCGDCKARLLGNINRLCEKPRETKKELLNQPKILDEIIADGNSRARKVAQETLSQVKERMKI
jgi:tryptophanyl-tRNA synthetase